MTRPNARHVQSRHGWCAASARLPDDRHNTCQNKLGGEITCALVSTTNSGNYELACTLGSFGCVWHCEEVRRACRSAQTADQQSASAIIALQIRACRALAVDRTFGPIGEDRSCIDQSWQSIQARRACRDLHSRRFRHAPAVAQQPATAPKPLSGERRFDPVSGSEEPGRSCQSDRAFGFVRTVGRADQSRGSGRLRISIAFIDPGGGLHVSVSGCFVPDHDCRTTVKRIEAWFVSGIRI